MEEKKLSFEEMEDMLGNELREVDGRKFWKTILLEQMTSSDELEYNLTKSDLENIVENLMDNDYMWQIIDNAIAEELENYRK